MHDQDRVNRTYLGAVLLPGLLFTAYVLGLLHWLPIGGLMAHISNFLGSACLMALFAGPRSFRGGHFRRVIFALLTVGMINLALELSPAIGSFNFPDLLDAIAGIVGALVILGIISLIRRSIDDDLLKT